MTRITLVTPKRTPKWDHMRSEQLHSLLDGRAKWPDGTPRKIGIPLWERMKQQERARQTDVAVSPAKGKAGAQ